MRIKKTISLWRSCTRLLRTRFCFLIMVASLVLTCFTPLTVFQASADTSQMIVAVGGVPHYIDPATLRTTLAWELDLNIYETLVFFDKEKINRYIPKLAASWQTSSDGLTYTFTIRQGVKFHNGETLTPEDVEYSFERMLVVNDQKGYASWLFYDVLFGLPGSRDSNGNIIVTGSQIDNAVTRNGSIIEFHLTRAYPPFLQILAAFGFVVSKDWCVALGEWPGTWSNWTAYNWQPTRLDELNAAPPGPHVNVMCGTGPFKFDYIQATVEYSILKFDDYWGGWPASGSNGMVERVTFKKISDWTTRRDMFLAGELDMVNVPVTSANEVLGQPGVRCVYPLPELSCYAMMFTFNISASSPFLGVPGGLPLGVLNESGIPADFFSDIDVRKGFAYAFNYTQLIEEAILGEGFQPATPIIPGLAFYNPAQEKYTQNLTKAREHFKSAWNGQLWLNGFNMTICYVSTSPFMPKACEIVKNAVENLNNSKFHINIQNLTTMPEFNDFVLSACVPLFFQGWLADFADPHDFALGFMSSKNYGTFGACQNYENATIDALIDEGITETNTTRRQEIYYDLQRLYWEDCPGVPIFQPRLRRFMRDWVQGWYYNSFLSVNANLYYGLWKEEIVPHQLNTGENFVDAVNSTGTSVSLNTTVEGNMTITSNDINLEGVTSEGTEVHYVKCVSVDTTIPRENITFPIEIRVYYTDQEVVSVYVDQSTLRMFYWNGTDWLLENTTGWVSPSDIQPEHYAGYVWAKIYHLSQFLIAGQLTQVHAISVKEVRSAKTVVGEGFSTTIYADVFNQGNFNEVFNMTAYSNSVVVDTTTNVTLANGNSATLSLTWNTTGFTSGYYTISVYASPVTNETCTSDNLMASNVVVVTIPGDVKGDFVVDILDAILLSNAFNSYPGHQNWNPNADIKGDNIVDILDAIILSNHYGQHYP